MFYIPLQYFTIFDVKWYSNFGCYSISGHLFFLRMVINIDWILLTIKVFEHGELSVVLLGAITK